MFKIISSVLFILVLYSCKNYKEKDTPHCNHLIAVMDSLLLEVNNKQNQTLEYLYVLTEDSSKVDSMSKEFNLPDTMGFYQYIEKDLHDLTLFFSQTKKEINFTKDHLISLRKEYLENNIAQNEFQNELQETDQIIHFLKERVDQNLMIVTNRYHMPADSLINLEQNEQSE